MPETLYVHVKWPDGADDMVPESTAHIRAKAGDFKIVDATPKPWRQFKPRVPLGSTSPGQRFTEPADPDPNSQPVTEPADGPDHTTITEPVSPETDMPEEGNE